MNRFILAFALIAACATYPLAAQKSGNDDKGLKSNAKAEVVKDYKSFKAHRVKEEAKLAKPRITNETGAVRRVLKEKGLEISSSTTWVLNSDRSKLAYQSPNNIGVSVVDSKSHHVEIYNANGEKLREIPFSKSISGRVAFTDSKLLVLKGGMGWEFGFEIYDNSGKLLFQSNSEAIDGYAISNAQNLFAVTAGAPKKEDYFVLYNIDGTELWRSRIVKGARSRIEFSLDDKYALVKMPIYWDKEATNSNSASKSRKDKFYVFDVVNRKLISEGNYEE